MAGQVRAGETNGGDCLAARKGLEPLTFALGKRCSILLSYRAATDAVIAQKIVGCEGC